MDNLCVYFPPALWCEFTGYFSVVQTIPLPSSPHPRVLAGPLRQLGPWVPLPLFSHCPGESCRPFVGVILISTWLFLSLGVSSLCESCLYRGYHSISGLILASSRFIAFPAPNKQKQLRHKNKKVNPSLFTVNYVSNCVINLVFISPK